MSRDYRSTISLPRTEFPMKGRLPVQEPEILARWEGLDMYRRLREQATGRDKFVLHDGPPYANGNIHIGHALNKILKDVITRSQQMLGKDSNYVPGWDCHGLPIEWQIEQLYRKQGKNKDDVPITQFREECRNFAAHWIEVQSTEFQRLGILGDWKRPYTTMARDAEAQIVREVGKFILNGGLYRGAKPVMWSIAEKTALAEAEVEYHDHTSTMMDVRFPIVATPHPGLEGANVIIWTTTPWTLPGNRAIAFGEGYAYVLIEVESVDDSSGDANPGERLVVAEALLGDICARAGIQGTKVIEQVGGADLAGTRCRHPLYGHGYDFEVPLLPGDHVTTEQGTGFVHIAPAHGAEDFEFGVRFGLEVPDTVDGDGNFRREVPLFAGKNVLKVNDRVADCLAEHGALLARGKLRHSYPHSWRSKAPLIFRTTPQWFIGMEINDLRRKALEEIDRVRWVPESGKNRIQGMIESRPDWVISRQRTWGVPIVAIVHKETGEILRDAEVVERVARAVEAEGSDTWFTSPLSRFLGEGFDADAYERVDDILDVWFESGATHSFVLEKRADLGWPASLYLEGSDQHRGWFHSSLLESCGTRGRAPYDAVLTHGFVMDGEGRKMSKSLGNVIAPQQVVDRYGADILRLWVVSADYSEDLRISNEILGHQVDAYRRLRNTLRYLLGNLADFNESERLPRAEMPELERWLLHRLSELDTLVRRACDDFDFHRMYTALHNFCAVDLSAFYFDVRKDALYCDSPGSLRRRAARTLLDHLFSRLTAWLAPILCFTAEEAWTTRNPGETESVHARLFPETPSDWRDDALASRWENVRALRRVVTGALEVERREKRIGSSLEACPSVYADEVYVTAMADVDLAEIAITSGAELIEAPPPNGVFALAEVAGVGVVPNIAHGQKCGRCWQILPEVGGNPAHPELCWRCADAVSLVSAAEVG